MNENTLNNAIRAVTPLMKLVKSEVLNLPTPCSEWDVEKLAGHMVYELAWVEPIVQGKTIKQVGSKYEGDLLHNSAATAWQHYANLATKAASQANPNAIAHLSYADKPVKNYLSEVAGDLIIHGWDLAEALGVSYKIDPKIARQIRQLSEDMMEGARTVGIVGSAVAVDDNASEQEKLLAQFGRSRDWKL